MTETEQSPPQSDTSTAAAAEHSNFSFSLWPPSERTRDAIRKRLINNLSAPSILSNKYGIVSYEEAIDFAKLIEENAFDVAGKEAGTDDDGIEILQVYSKEISKRMLDTMKARFSESSAASETLPAANKVDDSVEDASLAANKADDLVEDASLAANKADDLVEDASLAANKADDLVEDASLAANKADDSEDAGPTALLQSEKTESVAAKV